MSLIYLHTDSDKDSNKLIELAAKLGIKVNIIEEERLEDLGLLEMIEEVDLSETVDTDEFLASL